MTQKRIRSLLESRLATWAATKSLPVAYQGAKFSPPVTRWLRATLLPANTDSQFIEGTDRVYRGVWQMSLFVPAGSGSGDAETLVAELETLYPNNLRLTVSAFVLQTLTPLSAGRAVEEPDWYSIPMSLQYEAR